MAAAAIVAACAVATVVTCGGFAAAMVAVGAVGCGAAAATTASTVAAAAFIGSSVAFAGAATTAALTSSSVDQFANQGNWATVASVAGAAAFSGVNAYLGSKVPSKPTTKHNTYNYNGAKNRDYVNRRGWTDDMINHAINNGGKGSSINMANGASCTAYRYPGTNNQYVVIENSSRSIVQVSNFNDPGWIPDLRITWEP